MSIYIVLIISDIFLILSILHFMRLIFHEYCPRLVIFKEVIIDFSFSIQELTQYGLIKFRVLK